MIEPGEPVPVTGDLSVPSAPEDSYTGVVAGTDYTLAESNPLPAGWQHTSTVCTATDPVTVAPTHYVLPDDATFPVTSGQTTQCVITNTATTLTVIKQVDGIDTTTRFPFTAVGDPTDESFNLADSESEEFVVTPGESITITETPPSGWQSPTVQCLGDDEWTPGQNPATATVQADAGEQIVWVFTNRPENTEPARALLIVTKQVPEPDGSQGFPFGVAGPTEEQPPPTPGSFTLTPPDSSTQPVVVTPDPDGSAYTVSETVPDGWILTDITCRSTGPAPAPRDGPSTTVTLNPGQIALCTFHNDRAPPTLTVVKNTDPAGGSGFPFTVQGPTPATFTLDDQDSQGPDPVLPGQYLVTENVPVGWVAQGTCTNAQDEIIGRVSVGRAQIPINPGDDITCTYTNEQQAALTVTKVAQPPSNQTFPFSVALNREAPTRFILDDDGDPTNAPADGLFTNSITAPALQPGRYTSTKPPCRAGH